MRGSKNLGKGGGGKRGIDASGSLGSSRTGMKHRVAPTLCSLTINFFSFIPHSSSKIPFPGNNFTERPRVARNAPIMGMAFGTT